MRTTLKYISQSFSISTKTEAILIHFKDKYCFIEYPTNMMPNISDIENKRNLITWVNEEQFEKLKVCFVEYVNLKQKCHYLHAPSFIQGYCANNDLSDLGLLD